MERLVSLERGAVRVVDEGAGAPILLVHGFPLDHTMWRAQIAALRTTHRVLAIDLRGFGIPALNAEVGEVVTMEQFADDCAEALDALDVREPVVFGGLSMGGYVAWQFWARHAARLAGLILCDTRAAADTADAARGRRDMADRVLREGPQFLVELMAERLFARATRANRPECVTELRRVMGATAPRSIAAALRGMAERLDMTKRLGEIQIPTLVVCGESDVISTATEMRGISQAIPGARYVEVPDAGHMAPLEQPEFVNQAIAEFLAR